MYRRKLSEIPDCPPGTEGYISPTPQTDQKLKQAGHENLLKEAYATIDKVIKDKEPSIERFLNIHLITLDNGTKKSMFSIIKRDNVVSILCYPCRVFFKKGDLQNHLMAKRHKENLNSLNTWPASIYDNHPFAAKKSSLELPTLENCELEERLKTYNEAPVLGLEYIVEIIGDKNTITYYCCLCETKGMPQTTLNHIVGRPHTYKYLSIHFPTAYRKLNTYVNQKALKLGLKLTYRTLCSEIEKACGRSKPLVVSEEMFENNKKSILAQIRDMKHYSQKDGKTFTECIDEKYIFAMSEENNEESADEKKVKGTSENRWGSDDLRSTLNNSKDSQSNQEDSKMDNPLQTEREVNILQKRSGSTLKIALKQDLFPHRQSDSPKTLKRIDEKPFDNDFRSRSPKYKDYPSERRNLSPSFRPRSPGYRKRSPIPRDRFADNRPRSRSPLRRDRERSPMRLERSRSPRRRERSPRISPKFKDSSLDFKSRKSPSPKFRSRSPVVRKPSPKFNVSEKKDLFPIKQEKDFVIKFTVKSQNKISLYKNEVEELDKTYVKISDYYEKNPEKHPQYQEEWKKFWNLKFKELKMENKDPTKYDFKPEWVIYWRVRLIKLINEEKDAARRKIRTNTGLDTLGLTPEEEEAILTAGSKKLSEVKIERNSPHASTTLNNPEIVEISDSPPSSSRIRSRSKSIELRKRSRSRSRSRGRNRRMHGQRLRSRERERERDSYDDRKKYRSRSKDREMDENMNVISMLRMITALENYLGSLGPKVVDLLALGLQMEKNIPNSSETILQMENYAVLLETVKEKLKGQLQARLIDGRAINSTKNVIKNIAKLLHEASKVAQNQKKIMEKESLITKNRITVEGIGDLEKATIASQIATALVAQGRTNVTTEELERLIHAVVGKANELNIINKPMATAGFLEKLTMHEKNMLFNEELKNKPSTSGLGLLQAAYTDRQGVSQDDSMGIDGLSDSDLKTLLQNFKDLSEDEQQGLVKYLKKIESIDPSRVDNLRQYIVIPDDHNTREASPFEKQDSSNSMNKPYEDKEDSQKKSIKISDDEEDYTYDEVLKSVQEKHMQEKMELIQKSLQSSEAAKSPAKPVDTQDIISNIMGSLQQQNNSTSRNNQSNNTPNIFNDADAFASILNTVKQASAAAKQNEPKKPLLPLPDTNPSAMNYGNTSSDNLPMNPNNNFMNQNETVTPLLSLKFDNSNPAYPKPIQNDNTRFKQQNNWTPGNYNRPGNFNQNTDYNQPGNFNQNSDYNRPGNFNPNNMNNYNQPGNTYNQNQPGNNFNQNQPGNNFNQNQPGNNYNQNQDYNQPGNYNNQSMNYNQPGNNWSANQQYSNAYDNPGNNYDNNFSMDSSNQIMRRGGNSARGRRPFGGRNNRRVF